MSDGTDGANGCCFRSSSVLASWEVNDTSQTGLILKEPTPKSSRQTHIWWIDVVNPDQSQELGRNSSDQAVQPCDMLMGHLWTWNPTSIAKTKNSSYFLGHDMIGLTSCTLTFGMVWGPHGWWLPHKREKKRKRCLLPPGAILRLRFSSFSALRIY